MYCVARVRACWDEVNDPSSKLKLMDTFSAAVRSSSCSLKHILQSVTSAPDGGDVEQDFKLACRGPVLITQRRQTRDGTDVDDSLDRDGYGLKGNKLSQSS